MPRAGPIWFLQTGRVPMLFIVSSHVMPSDLAAIGRGSLRGRVLSPPYQDNATLG